jgi:hypothetical protein
MKKQMMMMTSKSSSGSSTEHIHAAYDEPVHRALQFCIYNNTAVLKAHFSTVGVTALQLTTAALAAATAQ